IMDGRTANGRTDNAGAAVPSRRSGLSRRLSPSPSLSLPLQRNVAVLLRRIGVALVLQHLEGVDDARPGVFRQDDVVDVAELGGLVRIGEGVPVLVDEPGPLLLDVGGFLE